MLTHLAHALDGMPVVAGLDGARVVLLEVTGMAQQALQQQADGVLSCLLLIRAGCCCKSHVRTRGRQLFRGGRVHTSQAKSNKACISPRLF
jgi:hypothetical protein